jgi:two-component system LytT family response regulator
MRATRIVVIDDEPLARRGVRAHLSPVANAEIVAECRNGREAVAAIRTHAPDLILLDIHLPDFDGFEVLRQIDAKARPLVIFLTAYEEHALAAFEAHALDYLLKPIDNERLLRAVERASQLIAAKNLGLIQERLNDLLRRTDGAASFGKYKTHLAVKTGRRADIVSLADVNWINADGDYVTLHTNGKTHLLRQTISSLAAALDPEEFLRIHRSVIVKKSQIAELTTLESGSYLVRLRDGKSVRTSRPYSRRLLDWL